MDEGWTGRQPVRWDTQMDEWTEEKTDGLLITFTKISIQKPRPSDKLMGKQTEQ